MVGRIKIPELNAELFMESVSMTASANFRFGPQQMYMGRFRLLFAGGPPDPLQLRTCLTDRDLGNGYVIKEISQVEIYQTAPDVGMRTGYFGGVTIAIEAYLSHVSQVSASGLSWNVGYPYTRRVVLTGSTFKLRFKWKEFGTENSVYIEEDYGQKLKALFVDGVSRLIPRDLVFEEEIKEEEQW